MNLVDGSILMYDSSLMGLKVCSRYVFCVCICNFFLFPILILCLLSNIENIGNNFRVSSQNTKNNF